MGGTVSAGHNNEELIDNLVEADCIKTPIVEKVFRGVDRADYYLPEYRDSAYKDLAWKNGNIHLSAPCIYAEVLEALSLKAGHRFLNLGSGTGYLSTLAGLILGSYGINHGVEYHEDVIIYARERLENFKKTADAFDRYDFCEPIFTHGNCLLINSGCSLYDRVYCGASCPPEHENYMKNLIKIGGVLVMPLEDHLLQIKRTGETEWETNSVLPVSFASLIPYNAEKEINHVQLPDVKVMSLQEMIRTTIRSILRNNINTEHPNIGRVKKSTKRPKRTTRVEKRRRINILPSNIGMMLLGSLNDSEGEDDTAVGGPLHSDDSSRDSDMDASNSSSHSSRSTDDHRADYIYQQMIVMQRHFFDMSRNERLQERGDEEEEEERADRNTSHESGEGDDEDQGIDLDEDSSEDSMNRVMKKRSRPRRAILENGTLSTDSEGTSDVMEKDDEGENNYENHLPQASVGTSPCETQDVKDADDKFVFTPPSSYDRNRSTLSTSSGEELEGEYAHLEATSSTSNAIPIGQTSAERRRFSSSASMSTSVTSGFGTCSSIEEPTDMEVIGKELSSHAEEDDFCDSKTSPSTNDGSLSLSSPLLCTSSNQDANSKHDCQTTVFSSGSNRNTNGCSNGLSKSEDKEENSSSTSASTTESCDKNQPHLSNSSTSTKHAKRAGKSENGASFSPHNPPKVSINSASPVLEEEDEDHDDTDGDVDDVDMHRIRDDELPRVEEEEEMDDSDAGLTFRQCMNEKVQVLPIPQALKQFILHYRT